jgi:cytochrome P450 PksS
MHLKSIDGPAMRTLQPDFTSQHYFRDPATNIEKLRRSGPVIETRFPMVGKVWITTTYEAAGRVLKDSQIFSPRNEERRRRSPLVDAR